MSTQFSAKGRKFNNHPRKMRDRRKTTKQRDSSASTKKKKGETTKILKKFFLSKSPDTPQTLRDLFERKAIIRNQTP